MVIPANGIKSQWVPLQRVSLETGLSRPLLWCFWRGERNRGASRLIDLWNDRQKRPIKKRRESGRRTCLVHRDDLHHLKQLAAAMIRERKNQLADDWPTIEAAARQTSTSVSIWRQWCAGTAACPALNRKPNYRLQYRPKNGSGGQVLKNVIDPADVAKVRKAREAVPADDLILLFDVPTRFPAITKHMLDGAKRKDWLFRGVALTVVRRPAPGGNRQMRSREHLKVSELEAVLANQAGADEPIRATHDGKKYIAFASAREVYGLNVRSWKNRGECPFLPGRRLPEIRKLVVPARYRWRVEYGARRDLPIDFALEADLIEARAARDKWNPVAAMQAAKKGTPPAADAPKAGGAAIEETVVPRVVPRDNSAVFCAPTVPRKYQQFAERVAQTPGADKRAIAGDLFGENAESARRQFNRYVAKGKIVLPAD